MSEAAGQVDHLEGSAELRRALSARHFQADADALFALSMRELCLIRVCIANVDDLPKTRAELDARCPGVVEALGPSAERLLTLFRKLNVGAHDWLSERLPVIRGCAEDIAHYGRQVEGTYAAVRSLVRQLASCAWGEDDALRGQLLNDLDARLGALCAHARSRAARAARTSDDSASWVDRIRRVVGELRALSDGIESSLSSRSSELEGVNARISALNERIARLNRDAAVHERRAAEKARLVWIPFAGVGFATAAIVEAETAKRLAREAARLSMESMAARTPQQQAYRAIALLRTTSEWIEAVEGDLESVLPVLGHLRGIWDGIAADLSTIPGVLRRVARQPDPRPILMEMGLDAAVLEWGALAEKAGAFLSELALPAEPERLPLEGSAPGAPRLAG